MDASLDANLIVKITIPYAFGEAQFGLIPKVLTHLVPNLHGNDTYRTAVEMVSATPLEYLDRWILNNQIFQDNVRLESVIRWRDGLVSFAISQPNYTCEPASEVQITEAFLQSGWKLIKDPDSQHQFFYHYGYNALAVDALPRNCYWLDGAVQPFDVILSHPDDNLADKLRL